MSWLTSTPQSRTAHPGAALAPSNARRCAWACLLALTLTACGEDAKKPPPAAGETAAAAAPAGPDLVLERWELLGENPRNAPLKELFKRYEAAKIEELANPMLANIVDFVPKPNENRDELGGQQNFELQDQGATKSALELSQAKEVDPRIAETLPQYTLIILMTGIARPKAVLTDSKGDRVEVERGDPLGREGGRVKAILQYELLIDVPGKSEPVKKNIKPDLHQYSSDGAPSTEKKEL